MKINYVDLIKGIENEDTIRIVGKINVETLTETDGDNLLYIFPLIERLVLEIYKINPESNIEDYKQGIMKTTNSIFDNNNELDILPEQLINMIKKYFCEDGIRNKIFHVNSDSTNLVVDYNELTYIIMHLLSVLREKSNQKNINKLKIELI